MPKIPKTKPKVIRIKIPAKSIEPPEPKAPPVGTPAPTPGPESPKDFSRPPVLYGPDREPKKKGTDDAKSKPG